MNCSWSVQNTPYSTYRQLLSLGWMLVKLRHSHLKGKIAPPNMNDATFLSSTLILKNHIYFEWFDGFKAGVQKFGMTLKACFILGAYKAGKWIFCLFIKLVASPVLKILCLICRLL